MTDDTTDTAKAAATEAPVEPVVAEPVADDLEKAGRTISGATAQRLMEIAGMDGLPADARAKLMGLIGSDAPSVFERGGAVDGDSGTGDALNTPNQPITGNIAGNLPTPELIATSNGFGGTNAINAIDPGTGVTDRGGNAPPPPAPGTTLPGAPGSPAGSFAPVATMSPKAADGDGAPITRDEVRSIVSEAILEAFTNSAIASKLAAISPTADVSTKAAVAVEALSAEVTKAVTDLRASVEAASAQQADLAKAQTEMRETIERIKKLPQPPKGVISEGLHAVDRKFAANGDAVEGPRPGSQESVMDDLMKRAQMGDVKAQEALRTAFEGSNVAITRQAYREAVPAPSVLR